ncbi:MAG: translation initiation factor IF-2 subunit gamma [Euryarchaeota archaeon]|nr:translation initiation factor IF-2 subunit gamma [Euryarchaeota archaeon]
MAKLPKQPEVNIGLVGHVDHGKTTLTKALSGKWTDEHSEEVKRGISIKLGYADTAFYKRPDTPEPECFTTEPKTGKAKNEFLRAVSFVDSPGHETLMAIMLSGAAIMDGALLLVAANEKCPQPQTKEHLMALDTVGAKNIVIVQNKVDLVSPERARENHDEVVRFTEGTVAEGAPIIPISAHHTVNIDTLIAAIEDTIATPERDPKKDPVMYTARSFDINKPGATPSEIEGGIVGGSLIQGEFQVGDEIEIAPGRMIEEKGKAKIDPIVTTIRSLYCGSLPVKKAGPGGLVAIGTGLDPALTKTDNLTGRVVGKPGKLPPTWEDFTLDLNLLDKVVGVGGDVVVEPVKTREPLMLTVATATTVGIVTSAREQVAEMNLKLPVVAKPGQRVAISRRVGGRWRLIGNGTIKG